MVLILSTQYEPGFPSEWEGMDYNSAKDATPRLYGVSSGNGNDGVSRAWPDYYVRTARPYATALAATVSRFEPGEGMTWALEHAETDGESDYGISATILDPPDDGEHDHSNCEDGDDCTGCGECEDYESWSSVNGAWIIIEVFPVDDAETRAPLYDRIEEAFGADLLTFIADSAED